MIAPLAVLSCCLGPASADESPTATAAEPVVTVSAKAALLGDVLIDVNRQANLLVAAYPFSSKRRITVEIDHQPLSAALDQLAIASVSTWDPAYLIVPAGGPYGPDTTPPGWTPPPQTRLTLSGGTGTVEDITHALTNKCAAPIGYLPEIEITQIATQPAQDATVGDVLSHLRAPRLTWTRGYWLAPIDRAAIFGRYASLPTDEREAAIVRHAKQMLQLRPDDVRQALMARQREITALSPEKRAAEIQRYADEVRAGIAVLNSLSPAARDQARAGMRIFFDMGLEVYRDMTEDEQIETTPIIEAMGELRR